MDLYLTNSLFNASKIIDQFESLIWTERFQDVGDFKLVTKDTLGFADGLFSPEYIINSESGVVMMIETMESVKQEGGETLVTMTGRSLEAFFEMRDNRNADNHDKAEVVTGTPGGIVRYLVNRYCISSATAGAVNVIPNLNVADAPPDPTITLAVKRDNLLNIIKQICLSYDLGFQILKYRGENTLMFYVYRGIDSTNPALDYYKEYSQESGTLVNSNTLKSIANYRNHARVIGAKTGADVYAPGTSSTVSGFNRRTVVVMATDIGKESTTIAQDQAALVLRGKEVLADINNRVQYVIDGEIPQKAWSDTYFALGDIVMVKDQLGNRVKMVITESVYTYDATGYKYLPSFQIYSGT